MHARAHAYDLISIKHNMLLKKQYFFGHTGLPLHHAIYNGMVISGFSINSNGYIRFKSRSTNHTFNGICPYEQRRPLTYVLKNYSINPCKRVFQLREYVIFFLYFYFIIHIVYYIVIYSEIQLKILLKTWFSFSKCIFTYKSLIQCFKIVLIFEVVKLQPLRGQW